MRARLFQVDAFTSQLFRGNPAAVVPLAAWPEDALLQAVAEENNLAETAFLVPEADGFRLRWFTPAQEVDLCGHATLASAHVLFEQLGYAQPQVRFHTRSGVLTVTREGGGRLALDFPVRMPTPLAVPPSGLAEALGHHTPVEVLTGRDLVCVLADEKAVRELVPDLAIIHRMVNYLGVIVTARGTAPVDFVSRFFAPRAGIPEDPVTGSAHCALVPYWAARLGKTMLEARQVSRRGGALSCELVRGPQGERVRMAGDAVLYLEGEIRLG